MADESQTAFAKFYASQAALADKLMDPSNQLLGTVAIIGGVVSSLALARLYTKLSNEPIESPVQVIARRGLTATALGVVYVWWELNKAQFKSPVLAAAEAADLDDWWDDDDDFLLDEQGQVVV
jgi:hypothetical protein